MASIERAREAGAVNDARYGLLAGSGSKQEKGDCGLKRSHLLVPMCCLGLLVVGCVGSPVHSTIKYNSVQSTISENNEKLLRMKIGIAQDDVIQLMGKPERSEGYAWGFVWLYRTAMTSGIYGTTDSDFTPVVFGQDGKVVGWGRNFFAEHVKKYEISIKNQ